MPGVHRMRCPDDGPLRKGSRLLLSTGRQERTIFVSEISPDAVMSLSASDGRFDLTYRYELFPASHGTEVRLEARCKARGLAMVLAPILRARIRKADRWQLAYLKGVVEKELAAEYRERDAISEGNQSVTANDASGRR